MGLPKPALPYGSSTLVGGVIRVATEAGLSPVIVVTGFHNDAVSGAVGGKALIAHNPNPELGNVSSLRVGIDAVGDSEGAVLLLGDMPGVQPGIIASLCNGMSASASKVGWIEYRDGRGHPLAFAKSSFDELRTLTGSKALWPFLSAVPKDETFVVESDEIQPIDVNTPEDYLRVTRQSEH